MPLYLQFGFYLLTLAVYCYSSTAVQLAVQFFCCLCQLLWRLGSYITPKLSSYSHIKPFLRYLWSKGRLSEPSGKGLSVDPPTDHRNHFFLFFFQPPFFAGFVFFFHLLFSVAITSLSLPPVLHYPHPPNFRDVSPICPPTLLHRLCPHLVLSSLSNPPLNA